MNTSNLKDKLSSICGILFVIASAIVATATTTTFVPSWLVAGAGTVMAITTAVTMYLTGKAPDGGVKSETQIVKQNNGVA